MARAIRKSRVNEVPLARVKDDLSRYLREAEHQEVVITRHGRPAGVLIGFASEEDWFDYRLENDASSKLGRACAWAEGRGWRMSSSGLRK